MAMFAFQPLKNLNASHNAVLAREGLSFDLSFLVLYSRLIRFHDDHLNYAGINLTGYHPPPPELIAWPLIFPVKIPTPRTAFQCKTPAPGSKNKTKIPTTGHNLPSSNAKISLKREHYSIKAVSFQISHNSFDNFLLS